jgi:hypothetical protein
VTATAVTNQPSPVLAVYKVVSSSTAGSSSASVTKTVPGAVSGSTTVSLPSHCIGLQPQSGLPVVVCQPPLENFWSKALPTLPSLVTSVLALLFTAYVFRYNLSKDARSRRQSIQDDFWLRKVVSPVSIEPLVKLTGDILANLPDVQTSTTDREEFSRTRLAEFRALTVAFQALELIGKDLNRIVELHLEAFEDRLARYLGDLAAFAEARNQIAPGRPEAIAELSALRLSVLDAIKDHQAELGV